MNQKMKDDNIIYAKDAFKTRKGEYCILFEKMERTLQERIDAEIETGDHFPEWKI